MNKVVQLILIWAAVPAVAFEFDTAEVTPLLRSSCANCHDATTETPLNLNTLTADLSDPATFRSWQKIYDRIRRREMPPPSEPQPTASDRQIALARIKTELTSSNRRVQQSRGRVPSRRLTRREYENTLHDLLGIRGKIAKHLPAENKAATFDVVATKQDMSSVHIRSFLNAADIALNEAIQTGPDPRMEEVLDYVNSPYMQMWFTRSVRRGGGTVFRDQDDLIIFRGENYNLRSDHNGVRIPLAGRYRITVTGSAYQPRSSVTMSLKRQNDTQGDSELLAAWDVDENLRTVSTIKYLRPDDYFYVSADELEPAPDGKVIYNSQPASQFKGEGVRVRMVKIEGPLESTWPPQRTRDLFPGITWEPVAKGRYYKPVTTKSHYEHIHDAVSTLASKAFRRPATADEIDEFTNLAVPALKAGRGLITSARIPLRALLVAPQTLFLTNETRPANPDLSDYALASRLSYFLWRGPPDKHLRHIANSGTLSNSPTLNTEVARLLSDERSDRFVRDFLDQWLGLERIDATTPDANLYPEYDDVLRSAMLAESRTFFSHLIREDASSDNLINSKFTFLNRKLAEHYGIEGINGEEMRKVTLPPNSVRGGILTQASVAKVTANGTVTTPVKRGSFVLTTLLGQPPEPPPPGIGSIEPDTRGTTTIRDALQKHQAVETCATCHRRIDPPGFAMECFDPVGTFRTHYRDSVSGRSINNAGLRFLHRNYVKGKPVESAGQTEDGFMFTDIRTYKQHLMNANEQVARNMVSQLIIFATGGEIEFADREEVEHILDSTREGGYALGSIVRQIVASRLFRNR